MIKVCTLLFLFLTTASCGGPESSRLVGEWEGANPSGFETFVFEDSGAFSLGSTDSQVRGTWDVLDGRAPMRLHIVSLGSGQMHFMMHSDVHFLASGQLQLSNVEFFNQAGSRPEIDAGEKFVFSKIINDAR